MSHANAPCDLLPYATTGVSPSVRNMRTRTWSIVTVVIAVLVGVGTYFVAHNTATTTTTSTSTTSTSQPASWTAVWPTEASGIRYTTPRAAATGFAVDYLGVTSPVVGAFMAGDTRSGEVNVRPDATGPVTTVMVRQLSADNTWWVLGSATADIDITSPAALAAVTSPLTLTGTGTAFEGVINVSLRDDASLTPLLATTVMGGGNGVKMPFTKSLSFATPHTTYGSLVLYQRSAKDGSVIAASCLRVRFG
jgi:hypothetical protein